MPRMLAAAFHVTFAVCLSASLAGTARAERPGKGRSLVEVGIGGHTGQFTYPGFGGLGRYPSDEVGGQLSYSRFLSEQWTLGISGGYHAGRQKYENKGGGPVIPSTQTISTHSFTIRIGGDRYAFINDDVALYAGPGLFWTRGRSKSEVVLSPPTVGGGIDEGPDTNETGFNGRIGMYARLGTSVALYGHIGQNLSYASGKDSSGKSSWWSSTHEGSVGLAFDF
jgi:hypothetical protein